MTRLYTPTPFLSSQPKFECWKTSKVFREMQGLTLHHSQSAIPGYSQKLSFQQSFQVSKHHRSMRCKLSVWRAKRHCRILHGSYPSSWRYMMWKKDYSPNVSLLNTMNTILEMITQIPTSMWVIPVKESHQKWTNKILIAIFFVLGWHTSHCHLQISEVFNLTSLHTNVKHQLNPPSGTGLGISRVGFETMGTDVGITVWQWMDV